MVNLKKVKVHGELVVGIGKEVATNRNGFGIELKLKNSKVKSSEIEVVVCTKNGMSFNGEVGLLVHELTTHVLVG